MALPQDDAAMTNGVFAVASEVAFVRVEDGHFRIGNPHFEGRVSAQMLIGKKENPLRAAKGPFQHRPSIARRANDAAMPSAKRLQAGGGVDVGDRRYVLRINDLS